MYVRREEGSNDPKGGGGKIQHCLQTELRRKEGTSEQMFLQATEERFCSKVNSVTEKKRERKRGKKERSKGAKKEKKLENKNRHTYIQTTFSSPSRCIEL